MVYRSIGTNSALCAVRSDDEGASWTRPEALAGPYGVEPKLLLVNDGSTLVLSSGRIGLMIWVSPLRQQEKKKKRKKEIERKGRTIEEDPWLDFERVTMKTFFSRSYHRFLMFHFCFITFFFFMY
jgi:hypothetical protein